METRPRAGDVSGQRELADRLTDILPDGLRIRGRGATPLIPDENRSGEDD